MSKDLNKVMLTGNLGADPEMRYTPQGAPVTTFRVASNRSWTSSEGEAREETEWFRVVAWNKLAEICGQYLHKGSKVFVEGRLQTRKYTDKEGQERYVTEVVASDMIMLSARGEQVVDAEEEDTAPVAAPAAQTADRRAQARSAGNGTREPVAAAKTPARPASRQIAGPPSEEDLPF